MSQRVRAALLSSERKSGRGRVRETLDLNANAVVEEAAGSWKMWRSSATARLQPQPQPNNSCAQSEGLPLAAQPTACHRQQRKPSTSGEGLVKPTWECVEVARSSEDVVRA